MKKLNVGIFGAGRIGQIHAMNLVNNPNIKIKRIVDPFADKLKDFEEKIGIKLEKTLKLSLMMKKLKLY